VVVLEKGRLGFDGPVEDGIRYLHYDNDPDDVNSESSEDEEAGEDAELGADI
jgi:ABC-2 type transport system ATP-binding protein